MKDFFNYIKASIEAAVPALEGKVKRYNNQFAKANGKNAEGRQEMAIAYPACFVEFVVNDVNNYCLGIKDYFLTVRFYFGRIDYNFEKLESFDFVDDFHAAIQGLRPGRAVGGTTTVPITADNEEVSADSEEISADAEEITSGSGPSFGDLFFTSFQEIKSEFDEDHDNVDEPSVDYRTRYRSVVAYKQGVAKTGIVLEITSDLGSVTPPVEGSITADNENITVDSENITADAE